MPGAGFCDSRPHALSIGRFAQSAHRVGGIANQTLRPLEGGAPQNSPVRAGGESALRRATMVWLKNLLR
jgi:hypothetical protein